jgi:hypothetical protein
MELGGGNCSSNEMLEAAERGLWRRSSVTLQRSRKFTCGNLSHYCKPCGGVKGMDVEQVKLLPTCWSGDKLGLQTI